VTTLGFSNWPLDAAEQIVVVNPALLERKHLLIGITRLRNESLILRDTLAHVCGFVDVIIAYDDASSDGTLDILKSHPKVAIIIENHKREEQSQARLAAETRHRGLLLETVWRRVRGEWIYCFDADERIVGDLRDFLGQVSVGECDSVRVRLFDAYLTPEDQTSVTVGDQLRNRRRYFGPECRDILMLWRTSSQVEFCGLDGREPTGVDNLVTHFHCQHYGKAISVARWEATCDDYATHFPYDSYGIKWMERKGRSVHTLSDFGRPLQEWGTSLFAAATPLAEASSLSTPPGSGWPVVLLATNQLSGWTGSETLLLTLIEGLRTKGFGLAVYARHLDRDWAIRQIGEGVPVTDDLVTLRMHRFDLAHVQHSSCLVDVRAAFQQLPIIFASLGVLPFLEQPPPFDCGIARHLAISEEVRDKLIAQGVPGERIEIFRNLVSERCFTMGGPLRARPERILVLSYRMQAAQRSMLRAAARSLGASIRFVGGAAPSLPPNELANAINAADVVVSLGRGVVEAMLCGRVPLVFDVHGGDGLVTPENFDLLRRCNFSGRSLRHEYTIADLVGEFDKYRPAYGVELRKRALAGHGLAANLPRLLDIYTNVAAASASPSEQWQQVIAFCASLAREDLLQSRMHRLRSAAQLNEIHRIKNTVSWRITAPLRAIWNTLRRSWRFDR